MQRSIHNTCTCTSIPPSLVWRSVVASAHVRWTNNTTYHSATQVLCCVCAVRCARRVLVREKDTFTRFVDSINARTHERARNVQSRAERESAAARSQGRRHWPQHARKRARRTNGRRGRRGDVQITENPVLRTRHSRGARIMCTARTPRTRRTAPHARANMPSRRHNRFFCYVSRARAHVLNRCACMLLLPSRPRPVSRPVVVVVVVVFVVVFCACSCSSASSERFLHATRNARAVLSRR